MLTLLFLHLLLMLFSTADTRAIENNFRDYPKIERIIVHRLIFRVIIYHYMYSIIALQILLVTTLQV